MGAIRHGVLINNVERGIWNQAPDGRENGENSGAGLQNVGMAVALTTNDKTAGNLMLSPDSLASIECTCKCSADVNKGADINSVASR